MAKNKLSFDEQEKRRVFIELLHKLLTDDSYQEGKKLYFTSERQIFFYMHERTSFRCPFRNKDPNKAYNTYIHYKIKYHPELRANSY